MVMLLGWTATTVEGNRRRAADGVGLQSLQVDGGRWRMAGATLLTDVDDSDRFQRLVVSPPLGLAGEAGNG